MIQINKILISILLGVVWVMGVAMAKGFWSTLFALIIPFWGWYLLAEKYLQTIGWI